MIRLNKMLWSVGLLLTFQAEAETKNSLELTAKPTTCVALKRGNTCYQKITVAWQGSGLSEACLYITNQKDPLVCWQHSEAAEFRFEFVSAEDQELFVLTEDNKTELARIKIEIAWVYKTKKKSSWNLF